MVNLLYTENSTYNYRNILTKEERNKKQTKRYNIIYSPYIPNVRIHYTNNY